MMLRNALFRIRTLLGVLVKDWLRYRHALTDQGASYLVLCNRDERLQAAPCGKGYRCDWRWTSDLHAPKFIPALGLRLLERTLGDHPICRAPSPCGVAEQPDLSFVIGHRGLDRLPNLLATLESIAAQRDASFECVVVEQSARPEVKHQLPAWVRYLHTPLLRAGMPYNRGAAFNVGARAARGEILVLHDNDMLVPVDYAKEVFERFGDGHEVMNLKRFIFYLSEGHSKAVVSGREPVAHRPPEVVVQNLEAGGSVAISRRAYFELGGFDESFVGWGGEDNEFWDRAQTKRVWPYGYLPIVHLWHAPQAEKLDLQRYTARLLEAKLAAPAAKRINDLVLRNFSEVRPRDLDPMLPECSEHTEGVPSESNPPETICAE